MKSEPHPPMTLSAAAAAQIRLTVLMPGLGRPKSNPTPPMAARSGAETPVLNWRERLVCSKCGSREIDMVVTGTKRRGPA
jgi:hypothetical protein